ncbi:MAG: nucleotidyltransferase domain-containing protein [Nanoarchaeota archaeon]|nr:nucleotidyltransferase domain-containing protein [Nanoarchaeota archaeon]
MQTIIKPAVWKIMGAFYRNKNAPLHLREMARNVKMNESSISRQLNLLVKAGMLNEAKDGNMKKFSASRQAICSLFPLFDYERLEKLPILRRDAIKLYLERIGSKPVLAVVFGSTAKNSYKDDSDIDILAVYGTRQDNRLACKEAEAQTGIHIQEFQIGEAEFYKELLMQQDKVVQSALASGFPVFNRRYYYERAFNERTRA